MSHFDQESEISKLRTDIAEIREILRPIADTYLTVTRLGTWVMGLAVFVSILIGIIIGATKLFKK